MISPLVLALALVLAPPAAEPEASGAPSAASGARAQLDEKITLNLRDADLSQVLERLATLLGKTLILQPGVGGTVTIEARETPVSDVIAGLQASHALSIRLKGDFLYVSKAGEQLRSGPGKPDEDGLNAAYLADRSLPRRLASDKPRRSGGAFEFREEGTSGTAAWEIGATPGTVTLPGCAGPIAVSLLPGDAFDGVPRVVFAPSRGGSAPARIVAPGATFRLPECSGPLALGALDSRDGIPKAVPLSQTGQFQLTARILETGANGDEVLAAPRIQLPAGEVGTVQAGSQSETRSGAALNQNIRMNASVLAAGDADALVACSVSVTRDIEPEPGQPVLTIRIARADESLRLAYGKSERVTVSPTWGRGHSALVLELTVERVPAKR
ncbi:MAG: hypothetical protein NEA02_17840 [Thermoanaerobaculia bacterium]|nr:hypothetical protein [Thermoanaerobaculia bacterium]